MNRYWVAVVLTMLSLRVDADPKFEIGGLVIDQTLTRVGHLFYEELLDGWEVPEGAGTITIHERPNNIAGNIIWIETDDELVFEDRVGTRPNGIEEKAQAARVELSRYLQQNKDAMRELEMY